ncbi:hypothetical protein DENSPDRAFT_885019 [Dentipellis sp. KUC8613]|nr:hypothetical protein DENSPDRAFT_885019 [Dentipellis sp. KUC8613]
MGIQPGIPGSSAHVSLIAPVPLIAPISPIMFCALPRRLSPYTAVCAPRPAVCAPRRALLMPPAAVFGPHCAVCDPHHHLHAPPCPLNAQLGCLHLTSPRHLPPHAAVFRRTGPPACPARPSARPARPHRAVCVSRCALLTCRCAIHAPPRRLRPTTVRDPPPSARPVAPSQSLAAPFAPYTTACAAAAPSSGPAVPSAPHTAVFVPNSLRESVERGRREGAYARKRACSTIAVPAAVPPHPLEHCGTVWCPVGTLGLRGAASPPLRILVTHPGSPLCHRVAATRPSGAVTGLSGTTTPGAISWPGAPRCPSPPLPTLALPPCAPAALPHALALPPRTPMVPSCAPAPPRPAPQSRASALPPSCPSSTFACLCPSSLAALMQPSAAVARPCAALSATRVPMQCLHCRLTPTCGHLAHASQSPTLTAVQCSHTDVVRMHRHHFVPARCRLAPPPSSP